MTTDTVSADDLAAALREAVFTTRSIFGVFLDKDREESKVDRWQSILDRFDAQRQEAIEDLCMEISDDYHDRDWSMQAARKCRLQGGEISTTIRLVSQARAANHRILHLKRQLRALGGDA